MPKSCYLLDTCSPVQTSCNNDSAETSQKYKEQSNLGNKYVVCNIFCSMSPILECVTSFFVRYININAFFLYLSLPCFLIETVGVCCVCVCVRALARASERVDTVAIFFHCCFVYGFTFDVTFRIWLKSRLQMIGYYYTNGF